MTDNRLYPIGAESFRDMGGVHFRVWAPSRSRVALVMHGVHTITYPMTSEEGGYFAVFVPTARPGSLYRFQLDDDETPYPDPASRFQPDGPHGPSQVVDPGSFPWSDRDWKGVKLAGQVLYEMHIGTFTPQGTWAAAQRELPELAAAGITCLEIMPVNEFVGRFGWGYDGVNLFAPTRLYGNPDDFRRFVDAAHKNGLGVILDVVYNHLGPDGNYLGQFTRSYFSDKYKTEWGEAINFDGAGSGPVREFFTTNAAYWIDEFHLDGLRLDATQNIYDDAPKQKDHILTHIGQAVRRAAGGRSTIIVAENEPQKTQLVRPIEQGGNGLDALWNDDLHHTAMVALTGRNEAYYTDYLGTAQEFISAVKYGYLYQGQWYSWQFQRRGQPAFGISPAAFVTFIQNHDQAANSGRGLRAHQLTSPGRYRAMMTFLLLAPGTPMLFQGQEFAASTPFLYFADHKPEMADLVRKGRGEFLAQFRSVADPKLQAVLAAPHEPRTFERCKLDLSEREKHAEAYALTRDLLKLRRQDAVFRSQAPGGVDGAVLAEQAFVLRFFAENGEDRLLIVNFGRDRHMLTAPEPLLAPPACCNWGVAFSSEDPRYGGGGTGPVETEDEGWRIPGEAAVVLAATPCDGKAGAGRVPAGWKKRIVY